MNHTPPDGAADVDQTDNLMVGRRRIRYAVRRGTGDGPPLLCCNGIGAPQEALAPFTSTLDPRLTVIRFDVPGVGGSPPWPTPVPLHLIARTAIQLVAQLGHSRFDVLGISWGGALAQQIAFYAPRRCRRVVLAATSPGWLMVPAHPKVLRHLVTPSRYTDRRHRTEIASRLYGGEVRRRPELAGALLGNSDRPPALVGYVHQLLAGTGWTSIPWLPFIRQPVLLLAGTDDPIIPHINARAMRALLPRGELHTYDDGHLALITDAEHLAPVVSEFLFRRS